MKVDQWIIDSPYVFFAHYVIYIIGVRASSQKIELVQDTSRGMDKQLWERRGTAYQPVQLSEKELVSSIK